MGDLSGRARNTEEDTFEHVWNNFTANLAASPELHCIIHILLFVLLFSNPFFFYFLGFQRAVLSKNFKSQTLPFLPRFAFLSLSLLRLRQGLLGGKGRWAEWGEVNSMKCDVCSQNIFFICLCLSGVRRIHLAVSLSPSSIRAHSVWGVLKSPQLSGALTTSDVHRQQT